MKKRTACIIKEITTANLSNCTKELFSFYFFADVTIKFEHAPSSGSLNLTGVGNASIDISSLDNANSHTFKGVKISADGDSINLTASFSQDSDSTFNNPNAGKKPNNCGCSIKLKEFNINTISSPQQGLWVDKKDNVYVVDYIDSAVKRVNLNNGELTRINYENIDYPMGLWGDGNETLYVASNSGKTVKLNLGEARDSPRPVVYENSSDIWGDGQGRLFATVPGRMEIMQIDLNNNDDISWIKVDNYFLPHGIWGDQGRLFITSSSENKIIQIDLNDNNKNSTLAEGFKDIQYLWGDGNGHLFVSERGRSKLKKINLNADNLVTTVAWPVRHAGGLCADSKGRLYVLNSTHGTSITRVECE